MADFNDKQIELIYNNKYEVLTPDGFKPFTGILSGKNELYKVTLSNNMELLATKKHKIIINENRDHKTVEELCIGDMVLSDKGSFFIKKISKVLNIYDNNTIDKNNENIDVFEFFNIKDNHSYISNHIFCKQCLFLDEFGFIKSHIADEFIASVFPTISSGKTTKVIITSCVTKDTYIYTDKGIEQIQDYINENKKGGYEINKYKVVGYNGINKGNIIHNDGLKTTKIITTTYSKLECSLEHKLWACKNGNYGWFKSKELSEGDYISIKYGMNIWGNDDSMDIDPIRSNKHRNYFNIEKLTPDFCYLMGLYISEGSSYKQYNKNNIMTSANITITCGDDISDIFTKLGINFSSHDKLHYTIASNSLIEIMEHIGFDLKRKAKRKIIPKKLLRMSRNNIIALLQGMFDGDGCADKNKTRVSYASTSIELVNQLRIILNNFGIFSTINTHIVKPTKRVKVFSTVHVIEINSLNALKFYNEIGFRFSRKQNREIGKNVKYRGVKEDIIPFSKTILKQLKKKYSIGNKITLFGGLRTKQHYSRITLLTIKEKLLKLGIKEVSDFVDNNIKEDVRWVKINKIESSKNNVYDFSLNDIPSDPWCHSVLYNGMIGHQTPQGMNHFYKMWEDAKGDVSKGNGGNGYERLEIPWNAVPGRDDQWAKEEISRIGQIRFNQEYKCIAYNEQITIIHKTTNKIETVQIGFLHTHLNNQLNDSYQILTPYGFVDFDGIRLTEKTKGITLHFSDGTTFNCTKEHNVKFLDSFIEAKDLLNKEIIKKGIHSKIIDITDNKEESNYYDVLEVKNQNHSYISSGIVSHNCQFIGSVSTLIDHNFLQDLKYKEHMRIPKLPEYVKIWELPRPKAEMEAKEWEYVASLDSGYGMHADNTVLQICLVKSNITIHQVAKMSSNSMDIDEFCKKANALLKRYHCPTLIIEQNGPGIAATNFFHNHAEYENLVHFDPRGKHMGLWATERMKDNACVLLKSYVQRGFLHLNDTDTINELYSFGKTASTKFGGMGGTHDDHITSIYWIPYYVNSPFFHGKVVEVNLKTFKEEEGILSTDEERTAEITAYNNLSNLNKYMEEIENASKYLSVQESDDSGLSSTGYGGKKPIIDDDDDGVSGALVFRH